MKENAVCKACRSGKLCNREVTQKFEREGLEVSIEGIPALVCDKCSQVYFLPGIGDKISFLRKGDEIIIFKVPEKPLLKMAGSLKTKKNIRKILRELKQEEIETEKHRGS